MDPVWQSAVQLSSNCDCHSLETMHGDFWHISAVEGLIIWFVDINFVCKKVCIKEVFLGFIELHSKDASSLKKVILERLESDGIPLGDCRSQCYDNASVMAALLKKKARGVLGLRGVTAQGVLWQHTRVLS